MPPTPLRRAASAEPRMPAPRRVASVATSVAMVVAALGVAAGLQLAAAAAGTISGTVFEDRNADGSLGVDEPGIGGVEVVAIDGDGNRTLPVHSASDGTYAIDLAAAAGADLGDGPYLIEFSGWADHLVQAPVGPDNGSSIQFAAADAFNVSLGLVASPDDLPMTDVDATPDPEFAEHAAIGNLVWLDQNADGFQDETEPGVATIAVELLDEVGEVVATTTTDQAGRYRFDGLAPGSYAVRVVVPPNMAPTAAGLSPGDVSDSDIDGAGRTAAIELEPGEVDQSWDAGLVIPTVVLSSPAAVSESTPTLAFTGATATGLTALGIVLVGLGGTTRIMADRIRRTPEVF